VYVDAGASFGDMSMIASVKVGPDGEVHAFEPHPTVFEALQRAVEVGQFENITPNRWLLAAVAGRVKFYLAPHTQSSSTSQAFADSQNVNEIECDAVRLDDYWGTRPQTVDFMKLDVEGMEYPVLRGAALVLQSSFPLLVLEITKASVRATTFGYTLGELLDLLSAIGYRYYAMRPSGLHPITGAQEICENDHDLFCLHERSRLYQEAALYACTFSTDRRVNAKSDIAQG
jgi:FkbM family methyltransferase